MTDPSSSTTVFRCTWKAGIGPIEAFLTPAKLSYQLRQWGSFRPTEFMVQELTAVPIDVTEDYLP